MSHHRLHTPQPDRRRPVAPMTSLLSLAALALVLLWPGSAGARAFRHHRMEAHDELLRSPIGPSNSSDNWIWRAYDVPAGSTFATFEYDYLCSGGLGISCISEYSTVSSSGPWINIQSLSGSAAPGVHDSGHVKATLPTSSPTVWVRFRYHKASLTAFQDGFSVDEVRLRTNTDEEHDSFRAETPLGAEWTAGGADGGFTQQPLSPARALGPSEDMGPNTLIGIERTISGFGNGENHCVISYATDTAATHYFRVWENGSILRLDKSGRSSGTEIIPLTSNAGSKTLRLEYQRDGNPTQGTNLVRVRALTCTTGGGTINVGHWDFDGQAVDSAPYEGWTQSCAGGGCGSWLVLRPTPHQSYVPMQTFAAEPFTLDGLPTEYDKQGNFTAAPQFDRADPAADPYPLWLFATSSTLYAYARLHADSPGVTGSEDGDVYLYLDDQRNLTLARQGECAGGQYHLPGAADRMLGFSYALGAGQEQATISAGSILQLKGGCDGTYRKLKHHDTVVSLSAQVRDSGDETLAVEMKLDFYGSIGSDRLLGLTMRRYTAGAPREVFPYVAEGGDAADVYSWETVRLSAVAGQGVDPTERESMCCFAQLDPIDHIE